jgi:hypothetical protein
MGERERSRQQRAVAGGEQEPPSDAAGCDPAKRYGKPGKRGGETNDGPRNPMTRRVCAFIIERDVKNDEKEAAE